MVDNPLREQGDCPVLAKAAGTVDNGLEYFSKVLSVSLSFPFEGEAGRGKFYSSGTAYALKKQPPLDLPLRKGEKQLGSVATS